MFRGILLVAALAFASAMPEPNIFEKEVTDELQKLLAPHDPLAIPHESLNVTTHEDTSLIFSFTEALISGFATVECTHFAPPILTKAMSITLQVTRVDAHANAYTADGILNGHAFDAAGAADLGINAAEITMKCHVDSYSLSPMSACIAAGSLELDLVVESLEANFENADELNQELNERGPELVDLLEADIMEHADEIVALINTYLCKP